MCGSTAIIAVLEGLGSSVPEFPIYVNRVVVGDVILTSGNRAYPHRGLAFEPTRRGHVQMATYLSGRTCSTELSLTPDIESTHARPTQVRQFGTTVLGSYQPARLPTRSASADGFAVFIGPSADIVNVVALRA